MPRRSLYRLCILVSSLALVFATLATAEPGSSGRGRKYKTPPPTARIAVTVLRDTDGKPIENAAVVFHAMEGEKDTGNMELKTGEDGSTVIDVMPIGDTVRLQIIAKGFQTFGEDYKIDKAEMAIEIRLKRPGQQYSAYGNHPEASEGGKSPDAARPVNPPEGTGAGKGAASASGSASAAAANGKPTAQPDAQPGQPQPK
jgi:hypothetical protein